MSRGRPHPKQRTQEERNALIKDHYGLIGKVVGIMRDESHRAYRFLGWDDAYGAGEVGLVHAGDYFKERRKPPIKFSTYACNCIRNEITDAYKRGGLIRVPEYLQEAPEKYPHPNNPERRLAASLALRMRRFPDGQDGPAWEPLAKEVPDDDDGEELKNRRALMRRLIARMTPFEQNALRGISYYDLTPKEVAKEEGVTKQAICERRRNAVEKIKKILKGARAPCQP
jgi:RNA polymerase sigma factor (sigma-70 family)